MATWLRVGLPAKVLVIGLVLFTVRANSHAAQNQAASDPGKPSPKKTNAVGSPRNSDSQSNDLKRVLDAMDRAAAGFRSARVKFTWDQLEAVVGDHTVESGTMYVRKDGNETEMAANVTEPKSHAKTVLYTHGKFEIYQPNTGEVTPYDVTQHRDAVASMLLLGLGGSGKQLLQQFEVQYAGRETVDGIMTDKLELRPTSESVRHNFELIVLWIDPNRGISLRQQAFQPGPEPRSYRLVNYADIELNGAIPKAAFQLKKSAAAK